MFYDENNLPNWVKNVAKLLQPDKDNKDNRNINNANNNYNNSSNNNLNDNKKDQHIVTVQNENDWQALARLLGYTKSKINYFLESKNPALQLICDWIMSSDNTNLTIEYLLNYLEQIKREDAISIINNERGIKLKIIN